jgi:hypothetical protein
MRLGTIIDSIEWKQYESLIYNNVIQSLKRCIKRSLEQSEEEQTKLLEIQDFKKTHVPNMPMIPVLTEPM